MISGLHRRPLRMKRHANTACRNESRPHHAPRPSASATATAPFCNTCAKLICERRSSASATLSPGNAAKIGNSSLSVSWVKRHWLCIHCVICVGTSEKRDSHQQSGTNHGSKHFGCLQDPWQQEATTACFSTCLCMFFVTPALQADLQLAKKATAGSKSGQRLLQK